MYIYISLCSHSDGDPVQSAAVDLLPSVESDSLKATQIADLMKLVSDQHQMLSELRNEQQMNFSMLQEQITMLKTSVKEDQKSGLAEIRVEQRIHL